MGELRGELRTGLAELRGELRTTDATLRGEITRATNDVLKWLIPLLLTLLVAMLAQVSATVFLVLRALGSLPG